MQAAVFLQKCIDFVEQLPKFCHFEGSIILLSYDGIYIHLNVTPVWKFGFCQYKQSQVAVAVYLLCSKVERLPGRILKGPRSCYFLNKHFSMVPFHLAVVISNCVKSFYGMHICGFQLFMSQANVPGKTKKF